MYEDVDVRTDGKTLGSSDQAEGLSVECGGAANRFFQNAGKKCFGCGRSTMQDLENWTKGFRHRDMYRPTSKAGEAKGESSVDMVKIPSNLRSGKGVVTSAEMRTTTLHTRTSYYLFQ